MHQSKLKQVEKYMPLSEYNSARGAVPRCSSGTCKKLRKKSGKLHASSRLCENAKNAQRNSNAVMYLFRVQWACFVAHGIVEQKAIGISWRWHKVPGDQGGES